MNLLSILFRILIVISLMALWSHRVLATHNRAGEITYEQIDDLTIRVTITTYTKTSSFQADRDTLDIFWGDGTSSRIGRINGQGDILPNDVKRNFYVREHTYPGRGTYEIYFTDPNRIGNILNVDPPNSIRIPFHIKTRFTFLSNQFQGSNSSAILLQPPIDFACVGRRFIHNANAFDPDGDSLSYELIVPLMGVNDQVPNYRFPNQIAPGSDNQLILDTKTGDIIWDAPQRPGEYNLAFMIHEWRGGVLLNSIIRDMQILVENCMNEPPAIQSDNELCVVAGDVLRFELSATDADMPRQKISLTALGGPLTHPISPATFVPDGGFLDQPVAGIFTWQTQCEHISQQNYSVVFRAVDDSKDTTGLATLKTVNIKVVGPPPKNLTADLQAGVNRVSWDQPYACELTENDYFIGFTLWRRESSNRFTPDTCTPGMEGRGYVPIAFSLKEHSDGRYFYLDSDIQPGINYCYRVTASFGQLSSAGYRFNIVESIPSNEDCAGLILDKPFLTKVSVSETDVAEGIIEVQWTKPSPDDFDTAIFRGPYRFTVLRGEGFAPSNFTEVPGASFTSNFFGSFKDTMFIDQSLNTTDLVYSYQIQFFTGGNFLFASSSPGSSLRLSGSPSDKSMILNWQANIPWQNYEYQVFRRDPGQPDYALVGSTSSPTFTDMGLVNGLEYCFYIESEGTYGISDLATPLINLSQEICLMPEDRMPPCQPTLTVQGPCENPSLSVGGVFVNRLNWSFDSRQCTSPADVAGYRIYFKPRPDTAYIFLQEVGMNESTFDHISLSGQPGCYGVTSLDSLSNESDTSAMVCVSNCPFYQLPNTFTPNADGANDLFVAYPFKFIDRVAMRIFNRWGQMVFETNDPAILWDGTNLAGNELAAGVYTYICEVYESGIDDSGETSSVLRGFIELIR